MSIGVVIPTHNRYEKLGNLLASIREHWKGRVDSVVVVDDSDIKKDLHGFDEIRLRHIRINSRVFISKAKNIGWRSSQTDYIFFIDDDNIVGDKTLDPLSEVIRGAASLGAVMPAVLYKSEPNVVWVYATPFLNQRKDLNLVGRNLPRNPSFENRLLETDALPNASLVSRRALEEVGGFDERLVVNSSLDFSQRLKAKGWKVVCNTGALIYHDVEVPGRMGWWAAHGSVDPERVRYELRDWYLIMAKLHHGEKLLKLRLTLMSFRFALPNLLAYLLRGKSRRRLLNRLLIGYLEGIALAS